MPSFSLPWVVGPVPVAATIWSAYVTTTVLVHRREMTGGRFVAAFLFPLGVVAAISLMFFPRNDLRIVLTAGQIATTICFIAIYFCEKTIRGDPPLIQLEEDTIQNMLASLYLSIIIYFIYFVAVFNIPIFDACSIAKCYALELLFGGKIHKFSVLYFGNFIASLILIVIVSILFRVISKIQTQN